MSSGEQKQKAPTSSLQLKPALFVWFQNQHRNQKMVCSYLTLMFTFLKKHDMQFDSIFLTIYQNLVIFSIENLKSCLHFEVLILEKQFWLYRCRNLTVVSVANHTTWFWSQTRPSTPALLLKIRGLNYELECFLILDGASCWQIHNLFDTQQSIFASTNSYLKFYIPSTIKTYYILWKIQLIVNIQPNLTVERTI